MSAVKLIVIYPNPKDIDVFERVYQQDHVPLAIANLPGATKIVATKVLGSPAGASPFHRIAEVHFPSMEALQQCASSTSGKATVAHAHQISTGGSPILLIAEEITVPL
jgi:uncharacterized protein (TIGR02118 family)